MLGVTGVTGAPGDVEAHWAWWRYGDAGVGAGGAKRACEGASAGCGWAAAERDGRHGDGGAGVVRCRTRLAGTGVRATKKRGRPWAAPACACDLLEVRNASLEEGLPLVAGDVLVDGVADALGVAHLAEHAAVGARDALDGEQRSVGVDGQVH